MTEKSKNPLMLLIMALLLASFATTMIEMPYRPTSFAALGKDFPIDPTSLWGVYDPFLDPYSAQIAHDPFMFY
ncbi:hypothetical protein [Ruegeria sp.]|uniref:hypothetical protein n=1 Tax=Ruegeria sp. TaxID=1879320 RepID=UPI003C79C958